MMSRRLPSPHRGAVAAVFMDGEGRLLCVKPTYRSGWLVPGGMIEINETPVEACRREVEEELGLRLEPGPLLCVENGRDSSQFVFWGGELSDERIAAIRLPPEELSEHRFVEAAAAWEILVPSLGRRIRRALSLREAPRTRGSSSGRGRSGRPHPPASGPRQRGIALRRG